MVTNLRILNQLHNWPIVTKFSQATNVEISFFSQYDTIVFYSHPVRLRHIKSWSTGLNLLIAKIQSNFNGNIYLVTPFSLKVLNDKGCLSELSNLTENISYISLKNKGGFLAKTMTERQKNRLNKLVNSLVLKTMRIY